MRELVSSRIPAFLCGAVAWGAIACAAIVCGAIVCDASAAGEEAQTPARQGGGESVEGLARTGEGSEGAFVAIWNASTGRLARRIDRHRKAGVRQKPPDNSTLLAGPFHPVAFHPDGTRLVAAECGHDHWETARRARIMMWNLTGASASTRWSVETNGRCVEQLAFGGAGRWLAAAGSSGVTILDANTGALLLTIAVRGRDQWAAWTPDGRYSGTDEGLARLAAARVGVPDPLKRILDQR
jgi:WD40 repeat protein